MFGRRFEGGKSASHHRPSLLSRQEQEEDAQLAAAERKELAARKFDEWVRFKDSFDRGLGLFAKLDPSHCEGESWEKVAVILAAVDRSLGIDLNVAISNAKQVGSTKAKAGPRSMYDAFKKWSMYGHTFTFVKLKPAEVDSLGAATQQFLEPEGDGDEVAMVLPSLKYHFPPPPARRGLRTRPMTDDQKAMNSIFLRRVRARWVVANREMREQLAKYVEEAETRFQANRRRALGLKETVPNTKMPLATSAGAVDPSPEGAESKEEGKGQEEEDDEERKEETKNEEGKEQEGESKEDRGGGENDGSDFKPSKVRGEMGVQDEQESTFVGLGSFQIGDEGDEGFRSRRDRFMESGLIAVGIRRLNDLLEDDIDRRKKKENDERLEKKDEAQRAHEGWTRVKDNRRFRLPDEQAFRPGGTWKPPRFDFSGGKGLIRPNKNLIASTTLDIMRGQGMKYAHAITDARQGVEGDLEKSKRQIKRYKETVVQERSIRAAARQTQKVQAYREWSRIKAITEAAVRNLHDVDPPTKAAKRGREERWLEVGRALKSVDARLLAEWTAWTGGAFPAVHCQVVWDALQPRSCDTHSTSYSATRETLLKLLRPGVDYREAFHKVVRRRLRRAGNKRGARFDEDDELEAEDLVLDRRELKHLLTKELGIVMRDEEIRRLVDAFDTSKDRRVRWEDFEKLTGGVREAVRGDTAQRLERRCIWETTCPVTGMPNAYTVSAVKQAGPEGGPGRSHEEQDERHIRPNTVATTGNAWGGASEIITLKSGDLRRRNELADRAKHLRILQNYGLQPPESKSGKTGGDRDGGDYDDDGFEGEEDDDSHGEDEFERSADEGDGGRRNSPGGGKGDRKNEIGGKVPCEASNWPMSKRTAGLKTLKRLSKANREASELRQLLREGEAPKPPKFWSARPGHPDVGDDEEALTEELLLCWRPEQGSPVAFFSLEMSGSEGGKAFCQAIYREICRDPPNADGDPQYQFWVRGLAPNTRYGFRVRAFNGFGPGVYAHQCFATRPARPETPVAVKTAPTEVSLQWVFCSRNAVKLRELRRVFDSLDEHDDGGISRDELLSSLDLDHPHLMALLKDSPAANVGAVGGKEGASWGAAMGRRNRGRKQQRGAAAIGPATLSAFDVIEASDDEYITWDEIDVHFAHAMNTTSSADRGGDGGGGGGGGGGGDRGTVQPRRGTSGGGGAHFSVEACTSQEDDRWKEIWKGTGGTARVKMLEPGRTYRFRVRPTNCEGLEGPVSDSVVVNTMLPAPAALRVHANSGKTAANAGVWSTRVRLRWDALGGSAGGNSIGGGGGAGAVTAGMAAGGIGGTGDKAATKILMQWANDGSEDEGVSVDMVFSQYDRDGSGEIDPLELGNLLEALGVEVTEERLREAFTELDRRGDGIEGGLSFDDFEAWWRSTATTFVLMRDDGVPGHLLETAAAALGGDPALPASVPKTSLASFKGRGHGCTVAGLSANTLYHFRVCAVNNRTRSVLSAPLEVMTPPRRPESPVIIRCHQRSIIVKWYPGAGGAHKYRLQARLLEGLDGVATMMDVHRASTSGGGGGGGGGGDGCGVGNSKKKAAGRATGGGDGDAGWVTVYEGVDSTAKVTGLGANSVYHFRVRAINLRGVASEWSLLAQAATSLPQGGNGSAAGSNYGAGSIVCRPHNAAEVFHVDADDDIVVGDTIIFTERLYVDMDGNLATGLYTSGDASPPPPSQIHAFQDIPMAGSGAAGSAPRVRLSTASLGSHSEWAGGGGGKWATRVDPSGQGVGRPGTAAARIGATRAACAVEFVGERTAAAHVLQDSFRSMRKKEEGGMLEYTRSKSRNRLLRLEVIWSTVSREEADPFVLQRGSIVERSQGRLSQFETFRALWLQDERRKSVREEWGLLSGASAGGGNGYLE